MLDTPPKYKHTYPLHGSSLYKTLSILYNVSMQSRGPPYFDKSGPVRYVPSSKIVSKLKKDDCIKATYPDTLLDHVSGIHFKFGL